MNRVSKTAPTPIAIATISRRAPNRSNIQPTGRRKLRIPKALPMNQSA